MCAQDLGADHVIAWPTAEIAVMGPQGAAKIIFRHEEDVEAKTEEYIENFATPYYAAKHGMVEMVIEPEDDPSDLDQSAAYVKIQAGRPAKEKHGNIPL